LAAPLQIVVGDWAGRHVAQHQAPKLAAMEGQYQTEKGAPIHIGGWYVDGEIKGGIRIPKALSILAFHDPNAIVRGLDQVPPADRPPVNVARMSVQLMAAIGLGMLGLGLWLLVAWHRRRDLPTSRWFLRAAVLSGPASVVALECGWAFTEVGRQPWIVWQVMRVRDAVTNAANLRWGSY